MTRARALPAAYVAETERIEASRRTAAARRRHRFRRARWTWPNGHPRCLLCGAEQPIGGVCRGRR